jgi:hypothetical protein
MIRIQFQEPDSPEWKAWLKEATDARDVLVGRWKDWLAKVKAAPDPSALLADGFQFEVDRKIYTRRKDDLIAGYLGKCVYCEGKFGLVAYGDLDHYRPKQQIKQGAGKVVQITIRGHEIPHPGYFWLAYDYRNLLPTCDRCNRTAKGSLFPVIGEHAFIPGREVDEKPVIFHPSDEDPEPHFTFDPSTGILGGVDERASKFLELFRLNLNEDLLKARKRAYWDVMGKLKTLLGGYNRTIDPEFIEAIDVLQDHRSGKAAYALAGRKALQECREPIRKLFEMLKPLVDF